MVTVYIVPSPETLTFTESVFSIPDSLAGIDGRIISLLDITSAEFCAAVQEAGQSIDLNGSRERAFLQIKQRILKFNSEISIQPGDAIMYPCPDLVIAINDIVTHNFITYRIATWIDRFFAGNLIFRKVALQRTSDMVTSMPQVSGLIATPNLEGSSSLTWYDVNPATYPSFSHYNVYRSLVSSGPYTFIESVTSSSMLDSNLTLASAYYYVIKAVDKYGYEGLASAEASAVIYSVATVLNPACSSPSAGTALITWDEIETDVNPNFDYYEVWGRQGAGGTDRLLTETTGVSFTAKNLTAATWYFKVRAVGKDRVNGTFSSTVNCVVT